MGRRVRQPGAAAHLLASDRASGEVEAWTSIVLAL
jgi:hypothetical protein